MECVYCKKSYSSTSSLLHHQRTTKVCLKIQEEKGVAKRQEFDCKYCKKPLTSKYNLDNHLSVCKYKIKEDSKKDALILVEQQILYEHEKVASLFRDKQEKLENELLLKEEEIKLLKEKLHKKEKSPRIINKNKHITNITNNILTIYEVMSPQHVQDFFKKNYNLDTLLGGQKALARFVNDGFLKESQVYLCGDRSRQKFYIVKDGEKTEDTNCDAIIGLTAPGIPHVQDVYETALFDLPEAVTEDMVQDNYQNIMTMDNQRVDFKAEMSKIVSSETSLVRKDHLYKNVFQEMRARSERLGLMEREQKAS
jgi:hypothetical protein